MSNPSSPEHGSGRREFLGQLAATALVAVGAAACAPATVAQSGASAGTAPTPSPRPHLPAPRLDDSWTTRLVARHKAVFDSPEIAGGKALGQAWAYMRGYHDMYGTADADIQAVIVMRHAGIPMAFTDALWEKYELGKELKLSDPTTGKPARRNPFFKVANNDEYALVPEDGSLDAFRARGAILLGCNLAAMSYAYRFAQRTKVDVEEARAEVRENLVPTVSLQPNGIFAVLRAQEAGCVMMP